METTNFLDQFPTEQKINSLFESFKETKESYRKNTDYRMQNYFNCVDDYSWGGICDKVQDESIGRMNWAESLLKEQLENGKPFIEEYTINVLTDLSGNIVSETIVNGRFGDCWLIKNEGQVSFVSCSKKQSTYNKKGYKLMERAYSVEFYYTLRLTKRGLMVVSRILKEEIRDVQEMPQCASTRMPTPLYFATRN